MSEQTREQQLQEILVAYLEAVESGETPTREEWLAEHSKFAAELEEFLAGRAKMDQVAHPLKGTAPVPDSPQEAPTLAPETAAPSEIGTKIRYIGDYELIEEIGRGGMGVVYKAKQASLKRTVALKMILTGQLANEDDVIRFHAEAEAAAKLDHPGIVPVYEVGMHEGHHYFAMAYIEGESLARKVATDPLPPRQAAELTKKIADAVSYAHVEGVIHRDLKPANILIDAAGQPRVTDFGLAKRLASPGREAATPGHVSGEEEAIRIESLTATGQILGTPSYMPPEQASGKRGAVGPASDVYSLGAVLYCLVTGRPPFQAATPLDTLLQVLDHEPVPPRQLNSAIPRDLETICLKCLQKEPGRRYASARELVDELRRFLNTEPILARPIGPAGRAWRWCRRNPVIAGLTAALMVALVMGTVISTVFGIRAQHEADVSVGLTVKANDLAAKWQKEADRATKEGELRRRYLYSAHMNLAMEAWKSGNVLRVNELLDQQRPKGKQDDLRSFEWNYLWRECNRQRRTIELTTDERVLAVIASPNGRWIAVGISHGVYSQKVGDTTMGEVRLWDVSSGKVRKTLVGKKGAKHDSHPHMLFQGPVFSPYGKLLAVVAWDLLPVKSGSRKQTSPRIMIWDLETMTQRATIPLPNFTLGDRIAISPDNTRVAAGFRIKTDKKKVYKIMVWDLPEADNGPVASGKQLQEMPADDSYDRMHLTFSADGKSLLWSVEHPRRLNVTKLSGAGKDVSFNICVPRRLSVSADGKYFTNWDYNASAMKLFEADTGKEIHAFPVVEPWASVSVYVGYQPRACFSPDSRLLAVVRGMSVDLWDVKSKKQVGEIRGNSEYIRDIAFAADGKTIVTVAKNKATSSYQAKVWDANLRPGPDTINLAADAAKPPYPARWVLKYAPELSPDGKTFATVWQGSPGGLPFESGALVMYDLSSASLGKRLLHLKWDRKDPNVRPKEFMPEAVSFSPDGKWLTVSGDGVIEKRDGPFVLGTHFQLWRLESGAGGIKPTLKRTFYAPQSSWPGPLTVFSPDGKKMVYAACPPRKGDNDRTVYAELLYMYDFATGGTTQFPANPEAWFPREGGDCLGIVFSSDGQRFFTAHRRNGPRIIAWNAAGGEVLSVLETPEQFSYSARQSLALSKDDRTLASCHHDNSILLWDVSEQELQRVHDELKRRAKSEDKKRAEPAATPKVILRGHADRITAITFHPDGKILASASLDRTIKLWDVATGEVRLTLEGHKSNITALTFTPNGNTLISADVKGTVKVWRTGTP